MPYLSKETEDLLSKISLDNTKSPILSVDLLSDAIAKLNTLTLESNILYRVVNAQLPSSRAAVLATNNNQKDSKSKIEDSPITISSNLEEQLVQAWKLACLLGTVYQFLGIVTPNTTYIGKEKLYRSLLVQKTLYIEIKSPFVTSATSNVWSSRPAKSEILKFLENLFSKVHQIVNFLRLFALRGRRLLGTLRQFIGASNSYHSNLRSFETVATPVFLYLGWSFFVPRLFFNLFRILKSPKASTATEGLTRSMRSKTLAKIFWFQLANDIGWLFSGLLTCFLLVGPLLPIANFVTFGLQVYTLLIQGIDAFITLRQLTELKKTYEVQNAPQEVMNELAARRAWVQRDCIINLAGILALCIAVLLTTSLFINPFVACAGAALLVTATLFIFIGTQINQKTQPLPAPVDDQRKYVFSNGTSFFQSNAHDQRAAASATKVATTNNTDVKSTNAPNSADSEAQPDRTNGGNPDSTSDSEPSSLVLA